MAGRKQYSKYTPNRYQSRFVEKPKRQYLKRNASDNWVNKHGVEITQEERKAFTKAVNAINRKHEKMIKTTDTLPRVWAERDSNGNLVKKEGDSVAQVRGMGRPPEMIIAKRSKDLQRFKSKSEFKKYMKELDRINTDPEKYVKERIRGYKRNFIKTLEDTYGDEGEDIKNKIRRMNPEKYMELVTQSDELRIEWIYPVKNQDANDKLNIMRALLGMKEKDSYSVEEYE